MIEPSLLALRYPHINPSSKQAGLHRLLLSASLLNATLHADAVTANRLHNNAAGLVEEETKKDCLPASGITLHKKSAQLISEHGRFPLIANQGKKTYR
jgi:hypothetical protein